MERVRLETYSTPPACWDVTGYSGSGLRPRPTLIYCPFPSMRLHHRTEKLSSVRVIEKMERVENTKRPKGVSAAEVPSRGEQEKKEN